MLNYSAEKADLIPLCRRTKFCLQFLCTPMFLQSKNFPALTPKRKINWQDLDLRNDNEDKPKCCTGNQKGTSELKTQTKLFQAPSSMSKGSKLKKSLLPGPQKWGHFSAEKPVTWEGASPVPNFTEYCACHKKWHFNFTEYCACHEKWLSWLILVAYETLFTMRGTTDGILQHHQILRLPRKMTLQHFKEISRKQLKRHFQCGADPSMIRAWSEHETVTPQPASQPRLLFTPTTSILYWKIQHFALRLSFQISPNTAPATKSDTSTSPNTAPATKSDCHDWSSSHTRWTAQLLTQLTQLW